MLSILVPLHLNENQSHHYCVARGDLCTTYHAHLTMSKQCMAVPVDVG